MASLCVSASPSISLSFLPSSSLPSTSSSAQVSSSLSSSNFKPVAFRYHCVRLFPVKPSIGRTLTRFRSNGIRRRGQVVRMAPEEERLTRRSPLDFPIEWEKPKPGRRPDIFPQFSPMKTPLPPPLPMDPPVEDDEEEEEEREKEDEEENKEEDGQPEEPQG